MKYLFEIAVLLCVGLFAGCHGPAVDLPVGAVGDYKQMETYFDTRVRVTGAPGICKGGPCIEVANEFILIQDCKNFSSKPRKLTVVGTLKYAWPDYILEDARVEN